MLASLPILFASVDGTWWESFLNQLPDLGSCSEHFGSCPHPYYADYIKYRSYIKKHNWFVSPELCLLDKAVNFNGNWRRTSAEEHLLSDARMLPTHLQWVEEWKKNDFLWSLKSPEPFSQVLEVLRLVSGLIPKRVIELLWTSASSIGHGLSL